jgi:hypothetical protein
MHSFLADPYGNVLNYSDGGGDFRLWEGAFEITADAEFSVFANTDDVLVEISNLGRYTVFGMPSDVDATTVTFRATYHSVDYDQVFTINKIKAVTGSTADPGTQTVGGHRLPVTVTIPISGTTWSDALASAAVPGGTPVLNDVATEYNNAAVPPYKETRFWAGTAWKVLNALVDGNLLVTGSIGADALAANSITTDKLVVGSITGDKIAPGAISYSDLGGARTPSQYYLAVAATAWSDTAATAAMATMGGPVLTDLLTQYNGTGFSETRFWNGTAWLTVAALIHGNLFVDGTIGAAKLVANSITANEIAANAITASELAANSVTAGKIAANSIDASKIVANSITAAELDVGVFSAVSATIGDLTVTSIKLANGAAITAKIGTNAVNVPAFMSGDVGGSTNLNSGSSMSVGTPVTVTYADTAEVAIVCNWTSGNAGTATNSGMRVKLNGSTVDEASNSHAANFTQSHSTTFRTTVGAGTHTFSVELYNDWSSGTIQPRRWSMLALGLMR